MNQMARISMLRRFSFVVGIIHESTAAGHYFVHENLHTLHRVCVAAVAIGEVC